MTTKITKEEMTFIVSFIKNKLKDNGKDYHLTNSDVREFEIKYPNIYIKLRKKFDNVLRKLDKIRKQYIRFKGGDWKSVKLSNEQKALGQNLLSYLARTAQNVGQTATQQVASDVTKALLNKISDHRTVALTPKEEEESNMEANKILENIFSTTSSSNQPLQNPQLTEILQQVQDTLAINQSSQIDAKKEVCDLCQRLKNQP